MENIVRVGVAVIIVKGKQVLLGKRKNSHGSGQWAFPGGHLEFQEKLKECAEMEVLEETGLKIDNIREGIFTNDIFEKEHKHYITLFMLADYVSGEPKVMEPEKCESWEWFEWDNLPQPLFLTIENLFQQAFLPSNNLVR